VAYRSFARAHFFMPADQLLHHPIIHSTGALLFGLYGLRWASELGPQRALASLSLHLMWQRGLARMRRSSWTSSHTSRLVAVRVESDAPRFASVRRRRTSIAVGAMVLARERGTGRALEGFARCLSSVLLLRRRGTARMPGSPAGPTCALSARGVAHGRSSQ
jgi:hypothetical protein